VTTDAASDVTSEATTATLDAKSVHANVFGQADSVARDRQVTSVHFFGDGRKTRRAFEWMSVSIVSDDENQFDKRLLLVDNKGRDTTVPLIDAQAWSVSLTASAPNDVQPSYAGHSVYIRSDDSMVSWIVASPTAEAQRAFLDELCLVGCIFRDLPAHLSLLPETSQPTGEIRLGRPTTSRTTTTAEIVALKVATGDDRMSQLLDEVKILLNLRHDGIVRAYGIYEVKVQGEKSLGMVLDYKKGKDLSFWIPTDGLPEFVLRGIMEPLCDALVYLHGIPVCHRDIKPSNVLCQPAEDGSVTAVLADFGLATHAMDKKKMSSRCGTGGFVAPEMFRNDWSTTVSDRTVDEVIKIDVFSFGMMIYTAVFGKNPFFDATVHSTYQRNARGLLPLANMGGRSDELQTLLSGLCTKDTRRRYSSSEALAHPWFSSNREVSSSADGRRVSKVTWAALERAAHGVNAVS
jgi:hypothetical protein